MTKRLRVPDEPRFVTAFALATDPGDTLGLLMEIGALGSPALGIVRQTREALLPACEHASARKDWDQNQAASVLREALAQSDSAAYLAYQVQSNHQSPNAATEYAEALAIIGCAADTLGVHRRPWEVADNDLSLPEWRQRVRKLLIAMPSTALSKPAAPSPTAEPDSRVQELAEHRYNSLEDQPYDPDLEVHGYDKEIQKRNVVELLTDLAREAAQMVSVKGSEEE